MLEKPWAGAPLQPLPRRAHHAARASLPHLPPQGHEAVTVGTGPTVLQESTEVGFFLVKLLPLIRTYKYSGMKSQFSGSRCQSHSYGAAGTEGVLAQLSAQGDVKCHSLRIIWGAWQ